MEFYKIHQSSSNEIFFYDNFVPAGFPSPSVDTAGSRIDLNDFLVQHPNSTYVVRAAGSSMCEEGIYDGDLLIVDRSIETKFGSIVIAEINGKYTLKKIERIKGRLFLVPANKDYEPVEVKKDSEFLIWGTVVYSIRKY